MKRVFAVALLLLAAGCADEPAMNEASPGTPGGDDDVLAAAELAGEEYLDHKARMVELYRQGDPRGALKPALAAMLVAPHAREPYEAISNLYVALGRDDEAVAFFAKVVELAPTSFHARIFLAFHHFRLGDWDEALADYDAAAELRPAAAEPPFRRGLVLQAQGDFDGALQALRAARSLDPDDPVIAARLVRLLRIRGETGAALREVDDALTRFDGSGELHHARGVLLVQLDRLNEAEVALRRALALDPQNSDARLDLDRVLQRRGGD